VQARARRADVFALTWIAYASYYLCRKQFAVTKSALAEQLHLSLGTLGAIDTGYLVAYAAGQFASGLICDRIGARRLVGWGMLACAAATVAFGLGSTGNVFAVAFALNGLFQSTGWPGNIKALTAWLEPHERGRVMGWWSTCYQMGGLVATAVATRLLTVWGWRAAFFGPAAWTAAVGVAVLLLMRERPAGKSAPARVSSWSILGNPLVWSLGAAYFCLKLIRYTLLFWLPFFLHNQLGYDEGAAGYLSISFEAGGAIGSVSIGWLSDRLPRGRVMVAMVVGLGAAIAIYGKVAALGPFVNFASMAVVGFMLFGPDALVSSVAAQDLGGEGGAGTAAGVINGVGSVGAILQGVVTAQVAQRWGWGALFRGFTWLALVCAVVLLPYALRRPHGKS
jgi:MFS transporter, OPA family, sugar phosphate sensor protein UhpC